MIWRGFQIAVKDGFAKFEDKAKQIFSQVKENVKAGATNTATYLNIANKLNLMQICERDKSNVPIFTIKSSKIILKHINATQENIFRFSGDKEELDRLSKELGKTQDLNFLNDTNTIIVCQLFKRFYASLDPMLLEAVTLELKSINNNVKMAVELLNSLNLHYRFNCVFLFRFLQLVSQKLGENSIESLVILIQPILIKITPQNACDEKIRSAIGFLIQYATEIGKISGVDCDDFINQLSNDD